MEDLLKTLLEAERRADAEVARADAGRALIQEALGQARQAEDQFAAGVAVAGPYMEQAEERSGQAVAELKRKYGERQQRLRSLARRAGAIRGSSGPRLFDPDRN